MKAVPGYSAAIIGIYAYAGDGVKLLSHGSGADSDGLSVESRTGFALWLEGFNQCVTLRGHKRARIVFCQDTPYIEIFNMECRGGTGSGPAKEFREFRIPYVDVVGLAAIDDGLEDYRDGLARERISRSLQ